MGASGETVTQQDKGATGERSFRFYWRLAERRMKVLIVIFVAVFVLVVIIGFSFKKFAVFGDFDFDDFAVGFLNFSLVSKGAVLTGLFFDLDNLSAGGVFLDGFLDGIGTITQFDLLFSAGEHEDKAESGDRQAEQESV